MISNTAIRILLIEDEKRISQAPFLNGARIYFPKAVVDVAAFAESVNDFRQNHYDVIICDICLRANPVKDIDERLGLLILGDIRNMQKDVAMIAWTGLQEYKIKQELDKMNVRYVSKARDIVFLFSEIGNAISIQQL